MNDTSFRINKFKIRCILDGFSLTITLKNWDSMSDKAYWHFYKAWF